MIVIDMQNGFIDGALGTPEAEAIGDAVKRKTGRGTRVQKNETL